MPHPVNMGHIYIYINIYIYICVYIYMYIYIYTCILDKVGVVSGNFLDLYSEYP